MLYLQQKNAGRPHTTIFLQENVASRQITGKYMRKHFIIRISDLLSKITLFTGNVKYTYYFIHLRIFVHIAFNEHKPDLFYCR